MTAKKNDARRVFLKKGTCSHTFFYLLNREFGHTKDAEEKASDPFAGGIMQMGYQCGMLWGASMAAGAEAYRRSGDTGRATAMSVNAARHIMDSFIKKTGSVNCSEITDTDFYSKYEMLKYMIFKAHSCFSLAKKWAPDAVKAANVGLTDIENDKNQQALSCASEAAKKMGASEEQMAMVAGFAGGLGLSGNACGALCAAIWINTLEWSRRNPGKQTYSNPMTTKTLEAFYKETDYEISCHKICGRFFNSIEEHSEYINNGGCGKLLDSLAATRELVEKNEPEFEEINS